MRVVERNVAAVQQVPRISMMGPPSPARPVSFQFINLVTVQVKTIVYFSLVIL